MGRRELGNGWVLWTMIQGLLAGPPVSLRIEWTSQSRQVATLCVLLG